ncbi:TBC1 domain, member 5 [Blastocladiella emersonii ATCC 22665]|nr:TBC1 domain, member 5 [Blastocladiella emersonii ATCC 22665]
MTTDGPLRPGGKPVTNQAPVDLTSPLDHAPISEQEYLLAPLLWPRSVPEKIYRWIIYLSVVSPDLPAWNTQTYTELRDRTLVDPHGGGAGPRRAASTTPPASSGVDHPLSQSEDSTWSRFFALEEVRATVDKDVMRAYPEDDFFQTPETQAALSNILCLYTLHQRVPYRQGMHELCAVLYWLVHEERTGAQTAADREALTYYLYDALMRLQGFLFERDHAVKHSTRFFHVFLRAIDDELYRHLAALGLEPHLFGIRWLRLLFAREFSLHTLVDLWDGLLCMQRSHPNAWADHLGYFAASVMEASRHHLMQDDYAAVMRAAMHYASPLTGTDVVLQAVQFRHRFAPVVFDLDQRAQAAAQAAAAAASAGSPPTRATRGGPAAAAAAVGSRRKSADSAFPGFLPSSRSSVLAALTATDPAAAAATAAADPLGTSTGGGASLGGGPPRVVRNAARGALKALLGSTGALSSSTLGGSGAAANGGGGSRGELRPLDDLAVPAGSDPLASPGR